MSAFWTAVFGATRPVHVEVGPGTGTFLLDAASRHPEISWLAIEHAHSRADRLAATVAAHGWDHVRVLFADAACVIGSLIPDASVDAYHIYFPDPWWKRRHHRRRLFTPAFVDALARTLRPTGYVFLATDVEQVFELMLATVAPHPAFARDDQARSPRTQVTSFERKGLLRGARIFDAAFVRRGTA